jgi:hypothetical protein
MHDITFMQCMAKAMPNFLHLINITLFASFKNANVKSLMACHVDMLICKETKKVLKKSQL